MARQEAMMNKIACVSIVSVVMLLGGCKDNPVTPPEQHATPSVAQLNATAQALFGQGKDVVTAAQILQTDYPYSVDTLTGALYSAGYTPQDLLTALKVVFRQRPRASETIIVKINVSISTPALAGFVLRLYVDSLSINMADLKYFLQKMQSIDKSVGILDSLYGLLPQDVIRLVYSFNNDIVGIVKSVHAFYPGYMENDCACLLWQLKCSANDAMTALKVMSGKTAAEIAALLKDAGYPIADVVKAARAVYQLQYVQIAAMLDQLGYPLSEATKIINDCGCQLEELTGILKTRYGQTASQAAALLIQYAKDLTSLGNALKNQYMISDLELSLIMTGLGKGLPEIVVMLKGMGDTPAEVIAVLRAMSGKSQTEIAALLRDAGYRMADVVSALRAAFSDSNTQIATILDLLGYSTANVLAILNESGCSLDELALILKDHYGQSAPVVAQYLKELGADFRSIADALKKHFAIPSVEIAQILKDLGCQLGDIIPILVGWSKSLNDIIADLTSIGFSKCDILHYFKLPC
jgi:hypothetical protein